jgi:hypothetical protein
LGGGGSTKLQITETNESADTGVHLYFGSPLSLSSHQYYTHIFNSSTTDTA